MGSGFQTFTAGSVLTASEVNNYLMEQSIMVFATTAARDSAITAPEAGMTAYINSGDSSEGLYSYTGTTWNKGPGWNAPWGLLGSFTTTSLSVTSGTHTTQQDGSVPLTVTLTTITNRNYRITSQHHAITTSGLRLVHVVGGTDKGTFQSSVTAAAQSLTCVTLFPETSGASRIFKVQMYGTTNVAQQDFASGTFVRSLLIEDIGPSGAPN